MMKSNKLLLIISFSMLCAVLFISCPGVGLGESNESASENNNSINYREHIEEIPEDEPLDDSRAVILMVKSGTNGQELAERLQGRFEKEIIINDKTFIIVRGISRTPEEIRDQGNVLGIEYDAERELFAAPTDKFYSYQYAPQLTNLEDVWDDGHTGSGVRVAVIDTGINTLHTDFGGSSAFVTGYDASNSSTYTTTEHNDLDGHGTHVAGIIAARKGNSGIVGVAPDAILIPYRVSNLAGSMLSSDIAAAIIKAVEPEAKGGGEAKVINMSLGGVYAGNLEQEAIQYALSRNVVVIVASGNEGAEFISYPASYMGVIAVGSSNGRDEVSSYSTWSPVLSVVAPGENILSLYAGILGAPSSNYFLQSGTSMAAPFVAGVAALLLEKFPAATPWHIKKIIEDTALDIGASGFDSASGHGRIRPQEALATTTLPTISAKKVSFSVKFPLSSSTAAYPEGMPIHIMSTTNSNQIFDLIISSTGTGSGMLPAGSYDFTSSWLGVPYNGSFTINTTDVAINKEFTSTAFDGYYRVTIYKDTSTSYSPFSTYSFDPYLEIAVLENNAVKYTIGNNDDVSYPSNLFSTLTFKPVSGRKYHFKVKASNYSLLTIDGTGYYNIMLQHAGDIFTSLPTNATNVATTKESGAALGSESLIGNSDKDNSDAPHQTITVGTPIQGSLFTSSDEDYFYFTAP